MNRFKWLVAQHLIKLGCRLINFAWRWEGNHVLAAAYKVDKLKRVVVVVYRKGKYHGITHWDR